MPKMQSLVETVMLIGDSHHNDDDDDSRYLHGLLLDAKLTQRLDF